MKYSKEARDFVKDNVSKCIATLRYLKFTARGEKRFRDTYVIVLQSSTLALRNNFRNKIAFDSSIGENVHYTASYTSCANVLHSIRDRLCNHGPVEVIPLETYHSRVGAVHTTLLRHLFLHRNGTPVHTEQLYTVVKLTDTNVVKSIYIGNADKIKTFLELREGKGLERYSVCTCEDETFAEPITATEWLNEQAFAGQH